MIPYYDDMFIGLLTPIMTIEIIFVFKKLAVNQKSFLSSFMLNNMALNQAGLIMIMECWDQKVLEQDRVDSSQENQTASGYLEWSSWDKKWWTAVSKVRDREKNLLHLNKGPNFTYTVTRTAQATSEE